MVLVCCEQPIASLQHCHLTLFSTPDLVEIGWNPALHEQPLVWPQLTHV
jgi:hypothetical protein